MAANFSTPHWPGFLTSTGFAVVTLIPEEASPRFSSALWCRCQHFSFWGCIIPSGNQGRCYQSRCSLGRIWGDPFSSFSRHCRSFPFSCDENLGQCWMESPSLGITDETVKGFWEPVVFKWKLSSLSSCWWNIYIEPLMMTDCDHIWDFKIQKCITTTVVTDAKCVI